MFDKNEVILKSDTVLNTPPQDNIHEGQISHTHGFVPFQPISSSLPSLYIAWEQLALDLPRYLSEGSEREHIAALPLLDAEDETQLPNEYLSRTLALLGNFAHSYYFNQRLGTDQPTDPLPPSILIPWQQLTKRIHRQLPPDIHESVQAVRIHYDTFLTNWQLNSGVQIDGVHNNQIRLQDLSILSPIFGNAAERNFNMTFVVMELRFAPAFRYISQAIKAVAAQDDISLISALQGITSTIEDVTEGLDYINPNQHSQNHVEPTVWTKTVAKIDGKIPGGVSGLSGSAMPLFHVLDTFIERREYASTMGQAMVKKFKHQPQHVFNFLIALRQDMEQYSIREYVTASSNPVLKSQYDLMVASYLGENGLMGVHTVKVYGYMKINFRNGRLLTNGGHDGTSTIATEPQRHIYDDFANADLERLGDYRLKQHYATKIFMHFHGNKATTVVLDVSDTALRFQPGDHCAIQPQNSNNKIEKIITRYALNPKNVVPLNEVWKQFFLRHFDKSVDALPLGELMLHADLSSVLRNDALVFDATALKPLTPRYYSVSPLPGFPQQIQLLVGAHNDVKGNPLGVTSSYLTSDATRFAIDRIPARHFHLPKSNTTPILMFAAGTGISPFLGFIDERSKDTGKNSNYLFFSTPDLNTFYHQEELGLAVKKGKLNFSVIFSRSPEYNTGYFAEDGFKPERKYQSNHVDQLIAEQAATIADLIVNQQAQIYVCGNPGFADTVRAAVISALSSHGQSTDPTAYVDSMMADFRFSTDVYSAPNYTQQYPSLFASEIATHNKTDDCWAIINGNVYNLTRFMHSHPGGQKIILVNGGMDMSDDYNYIKHNQNPQIEGLLQQYKIGVLATPVLEQQKSIQAHSQYKKLLNALTEIENTLRNNSTYPGQTDETYLWREVYGVFVEGSLASYKKTGSGNAGSLNYVLGELLNNACLVTDYPDSVALQEHAKELITNASELANYIRQSTMGTLLPQDAIARKRIFDLTLEHTSKFISELKAASIEALKGFEVNGDQYDVNQLQQKLAQIDKAITQHSWLVGHILKNLPKQTQSVPKMEDITGGCVFAPKAKEGRHADALSTLGLMPIPKRLKPESSELTVKPGSFA